MNVSPSTPAPALLPGGVSSTPADDGPPARGGFDDVLSGLGSGGKSKPDEPPGDALTPSGPDVAASTATKQSIGTGLSGLAKLAAVAAALTGTTHPSGGPQGTAASVAAPDADIGSTPDQATATADLPTVRFGKASNEGLLAGGSKPVKDDGSAGTDATAGGSDASATTGTPAGLLALLATVYGTVSPASNAAPSSVGTAGPSGGDTPAHPGQHEEHEVGAAKLPAAAADANSLLTDQSATVTTQVGATAKAGATASGPVATPTGPNPLDPDTTAELGVGNITVQAYLTPVSNAVAPAAAQVANAVPPLAKAIPAPQTGASPTPKTSAKGAASSKLPSSASAPNSADPPRAGAIAAHASAAPNVPTPADSNDDGQGDRGAKGADTPIMDAASGTHEPDASVTFGPNATALGGVTSAQLSPAMPATIRAISDAVGALAAQEPTSGSAPASDPSTPGTSLASARTMTLQLSPQHLGTVNVRLHISGQALDVDLTVTSDQTLGLVSRDRDVLASALRDQSYDLNSLTIQGTAAGSAPTGDQYAPQQGSQGSGTHSGERQAWSGGNGSASNGRSPPPGRAAKPDEPSVADRSADARSSALFV